MDHADVNPSLYMDLLARWQSCPFAVSLCGNLWNVSDPDLWIDHKAWPQTCLVTVNLPDGWGSRLKLAAISGAALLSLSGTVVWVLL